MEASVEMDVGGAPAAPQTRLTHATKTSLSERFQQMGQEPAKKMKPKVKKVVGGGMTRKAVPDFDLEHFDDGLDLPKHRVRTGGLRSLGLGQPMGNELFALQLAARQRQELQTQRIIAQARLAAQAELVALLGTTTTGYPALGYDYGNPFVSRQSRAGHSRIAPSSPATAMALAQTPQIPAPMRARLGLGRGQTHPGGLGGVRKGPGSIVKTNMSGLGRGRGTPHEGGKWKGELKTKEELDQDLDQYMAQKRKSTKPLGPC